MNKKLILAWSVFIGVVVIFAISVEYLYHVKQYSICGYQCRILVNTDLILEDNNDKKIETKHEEISTNEKNNQHTMYENTKYGDLPVISQSGECSYTVFAAKHNIDSNKKPLAVAIFLNDATVEEITRVIQKLGNNKITFVVPYYLDCAGSAINNIIENGHEFVLQLPTQNSISDNKKEKISPILANDKLENTLDKLNYVLASAKQYIGVANATATLLTKSSKDAEAIALLLAKRGLVLLDMEDTPSLMSECANANSCTYIAIKTRYSENNMEIALQNQSIAVNMREIDDFLKTIDNRKDIAILPVSYLLKITEK